MSDKKKRRILLVSDTHGKNENLERILKKFSFDALICCGDGEGLEQELAYFPGCPADISMVRGNNDYNGGLHYEAEVYLGSRKAFVTHGHRYRLYEGFDSLGMAARQRECSVCLFGHIHRPVCRQFGEMIFINPGSLSEPRQEDGIPTCAVLETEGERLQVSFINGITLDVYKENGQEMRSFEFDR